MREKRKKKLVILSMLLMLVFMSVGYAAFSTTLIISATGNVTGHWDVRITNIEEVNKIGEGESAATPIYTNTTASMEANLYNKGDAVEYDITVTNNGNIDAKLDDIITNIKSDNDAINITFSGVSEQQELKQGASHTIRVKIEYNPYYSGDGEGSGEVEVILAYTQANL